MIVSCSSFVNRAKIWILIRQWSCVESGESPLRDSRMNVFESIRTRIAVLTLFCVVSAVSAAASTNVVVWDTMKRDGKWQKVPSNLMELEKDALKAASDPGYYGRDYLFTGD